MAPSMDRHNRRNHRRTRRRDLISRQWSAPPVSGGAAVRPVLEPLEPRVLLDATFDNDNANGLWHEAANWSNDTLPVDGDTIIIPDGTGPVTFNDNAADISIASIQADDPLAVDAFGSVITLSGAGPFNFNDGLRLNGSTITGVGDVTISGAPFRFDLGAWSVSGTTTVQGGMELAVSTTFFEGVTLELESNTIWSSGALIMRNDSVINNHAGSTFDIHGDLMLDDGSTDGTETFNNFGTVIKSAGAGNAQIEPRFNVDGSGANDGVVDVSSGAIFLSWQDFGTGGGTFTSATVQGSGILVMEGFLSTYDFDVDTTITVGEASFNSGTSNIAGTYDVAARTSLTGGMANFTAGAVITNLGAVSSTSGTLTVDATPTIAVESITITGGTLTFNSGEDLALDSYDQRGGTVSGTDNITILPGSSPTMTWNLGTIEGARTVTVRGGLAMGFAAGKLLNTATLDIESNTIWTSGALRLRNNATVNNRAGSVFEAQGNLFVNTTLPGGNETFNNFGTMVKSAGDGSVVIEPQFTVDGTVEVQSGTFSIEGPFTNYDPTTKTLTGGTYRVISHGALTPERLQWTGAEVNVNEANILLSGPNAMITNTTAVDALSNLAIVSGSGVLTVENGASMTVNVPFENGGSVSIDNGTFTVSGGATYTQTGGRTTLDDGGMLVADDVQIGAGVLEGNGTVMGNVTVTGTGEAGPGLSPGLLSISNNLTITPAGALNIDVSNIPPAQPFDQFDVGRDLVLGGTLNLNTLDGFVPTAGQSFAVTTGPLTSTGTFDTITGSSITGTGRFYDTQYGPDGFELVVDQFDLGAAVTTDEGALVDFLGVFNDPGANDDYSATIDWGDGSAIDVGTIDNAANTVSGSHVYADDGVYTVNVVILADDGTTGSDTLTITVNNVAPTVDAGANQGSNEGELFTLSLATFNDPGTLDTHTATIDWGDGTAVEAGTVTENPFGPPGNTAGADGTASASHVYADNGSYTVTVTVTDDDGASNSDTATVTVNNVAPTLDAGLDQTIIQGDGASLDPATFNDLGTLDTHTATIDWGDNTPVDTGTVTETPFGPPGSTAGLDGTVDGGHTYATDGTFTVTVTVMDDDGDSTSDTLTVTVSLAAPPTVTNVLVRGSNWAMGDHAIPVGSVTQLTPLRWGNVNEVVVQFSEPVAIPAGGILLRGVLGPDGVLDANIDYVFTISTGTGSSGEFEAVLALAQPFGIDKMLLVVNAAASVSNGFALDGEWANSSDTYPSGDGSPGGDFRFRMDSLPGDTDGDGSSGDTDLSVLLTDFGKAPPTPLQDPRADLDGDMSVGDTDLAILLTNFGKSLPGGTPAAPTTTGAPVFGTTLSAAPAAPMTSGGDPSGDDQVDLITAAEPSAADRNEASAPSPLARGWGHRTHGLRAQLAAAAQDGRRGRRPHTTRPIMAAIERPSVAGLDWVRLRDLSAIGTVSGTMLQSTRR